MLYIFLVDNGTMMPLDMNLALETVGFLKGVIARSCCIPPEKQVLLISGGESLEDRERVCKYTAGTDTNPIYLFSMATIESHTPPVTQPEVPDLDAELQAKVDKTKNLRDTQDTVAIRAQLAQEYVKASAEQTRFCETLIHDQHLQHQGWSAVVANLEDIVTALKKRTDKMEETFKEYLNNRTRYKKVIDTFDDDIALLHQIPVFPALLEASDSESMIGSVLPGQPFDNGNVVTLLEWINARGSNQSLEQVADNCYRTLTHMDEEVLVQLKAKVMTALEGAKNAEMKEIGGLGNRLSQLEQLLLEAKRIVQEQTDLAQAFLHNQQRASGLNDPSILPDLCASHRHQLQVMTENYQKVVGIRKRCANAKGELSVNLHSRLKWIAFIQNRIAEIGQDVLLNYESLRRLSRKLEAIEQLHMAPSMFMATAVEVVRRRAFSKQYLQKTAALSEKFHSLYTEEISLRKEFQSKLRRHFIYRMFPGLEDTPPPFATECPQIFDDKLPEITLEDIEELRRRFPELAANLDVPTCSALSNLLSRSFNTKLTVEDGETLNSLQTMTKKLTINTDIGSISVMNKLISDNDNNIGGGGGGGGHRKKSNNNNNGNRYVSDSETDTEESNECRNNKKTRKRDKLTRSLPLSPEKEKLTFAAAAPPPPPPAPPPKESSSSSADPSSSSNCGNHSSVAPSSSSDGSVMKPTNLQWNSSVASLTAKISEAEQSLNSLRSSLQSNLSPTLSRLRTDFEAARDSVRTELKAYEEEIAALKKTLIEEVVENVRILTEAHKDTVTDLEKRVRSESEADLEKLRSRLELEVQKLEDCQREVEIYRQQLEQASLEIDLLKTDLIDEKDRRIREVRNLEEETKKKEEELTKKLTLEHELELDTLRGELENSAKFAEYEKEIRGLKDELSVKENDLENLKRRMRMLDANHEEKFRAEKDKIVAILEAGFCQREKLTVQAHEEILNKKHEAELKRKLREKEEEHQRNLIQLKEELLRENELSSEKIQNEFKTRMDEIRGKYQENLKESLEAERRKFEIEKEKALKIETEKLTAQSKREIDGLGARFKMMQTAGALERSPSASESELSMESPRQDLVDQIKAALTSEYENNLKEERAKWEERFRQLEEEHKKALAELPQKTKIKAEAGKQIIFNEALKKAVEQKDKQLEAMAKEKEILAKTIELIESQNDGDLVAQVAELTKKNAELEAQIMTQSVMGASSSTAVQDPIEDVQRLQKENQQLKEKLSLSMTDILSTGKISVTSVDIGDFVMIVWLEENNNYAIYHEKNTYYFLHSDSLEALGLTFENGIPKRKYATAVVLEKEYCQAKKAGNRFKVPQGTKFYRVKCKPWDPTSK